jgi:hypothetical protein
MGKPQQGSNTRLPLWPALLLVAIALAVVAGSALAAAIIKNGSFEKDSNGDGIPNKWSGYLLSTADKRVCNQSKAGSCSFKMKADGNYKHLIQFNSYGGPAGDTYTFSAWIKVKDLVLGAGDARLVVGFGHTDGSVNEEAIGLPAGTQGWTLYSIPATADENYNEITAFIISEHATSGKLWIDKFSLVPVP